MGRPAPFCRHCIPPAAGPGVYCAGEAEGGWWEGVPNAGWGILVQVREVQTGRGQGRWSLLYPNPHLGPTSLTWGTQSTPIK